VLAGQADRARPSLESARQFFDHGDGLELVPLVQTAGHVSVWLEEYAEGRRVFESAIEACRTAGAAGLLAFPLACLAELDYRTGRWAAAYAAAAESLTLAEEAGHTNESAFSLVTLACVEAGRGAEQDCRDHVMRALEIATSLDIESIHTYGHSALGFLELAFGRLEPALVHLEQTARLVAGQGVREPAVVQWASDLVMTYVRAGRLAEAEVALEEFEGQAKRMGRTWALAAAGRCRGLLAPDDGFEACFEEALAWHRHTPTPFPRALTELCLGERLRRAKRPTDARVPLRSALETFERLGADPWSAQARAELAATGERANPRPDSGLRQLTPQELQVALRVAEGATNREAAAALFLSPKTIEFHLAKVFRKLDVRSRTELARAVVRADEAVGARDPRQADPVNGALASDSRG
jgi:DNA-binding CsgD family transcriptional regulator